MKGKIIALALLALAMGSAQAACYSEGVRVGVVQKFSKKGYMNKSWEGELVLPGVRAVQRGNGAASTDLWRFSVLDAAVAKHMETAVFDGGEVAVRYCQLNALDALGRTDTSYLVTAVKARGR